MSEFGMDQNLGESRQPSAAPGWYPGQDGVQRYWDGQAWSMNTPMVQPQGLGAVGQDHSLAMLTHVLAIWFPIIGPLLVYVIKGNESAYVKHHAAEALNFGITVTIALVVSFILVFVLIGFLLLPLVAIGALVMHILAAIAANRGEWYRYPINLRMVPGAVG